MIKTAVILAGGQGTRLRPITLEIPKPLVPLQGKPITWYTIELMRRHKIKNIILVVGYKADQIKAAFKDGKELGVKIAYIVEDKPEGTGGALRHIKESGPFIYCNGDELKDIDLDDMFKHHVKWRSKATLALTSVKNPENYGVPILKGNNIISFLEKPKDPPSNLISAGLYILDPEVTKLAKGPCSIERDIFPILAKNEELFGFRFKGQWFDTGTLERYDQAIREWKGFSKR